MNMRCAAATAVDYLLHILFIRERRSGARYKGSLALCYSLIRPTFALAMAHRTTGRSCTKFAFMNPPRFALPSGLSARPAARWHAGVLSIVHFLCFAQLSLARLSS